jgi:hypothetical protein
MLKQSIKIALFFAVACALPVPLYSYNASGLCSLGGSMSYPGCINIFGHMSASSITFTESSVSISGSVGAGEIDFRSNDVAISGSAKADRLSLSSVKKLAVSGVLEAKNVSSSGGIFTELTETSRFFLNRAQCDVFLFPTNDSAIKINFDDLGTASLKAHQGSFALSGTCGGTKASDPSLKVNDFTAAAAARNGQKQSPASNNAQKQGGVIILEVPAAKICSFDTTGTVYALEGMDVSNCMLPEGKEVVPFTKDFLQNNMQAMVRKKSGFLLNRFFALGASPDAIDQETGKSLLHYAVAHNLSSIVTVLLLAKANAQVFDRDGQTPVHQAILNNQRDVARAFFDKDVSYNLKNEQGKTLLECAATVSDDLFHWLLDEGATEADIMQLSDTQKQLFALYQSPVIRFMCRYRKATTISGITALLITAGIFAANHYGKISDEHQKKAHYAQYGFGGVGTAALLAGLEAYRKLNAIK